MWGNYKSPYFNASNGVKQGGVLSPILFTIYIDNLLIKLKRSGLGCSMGGIYAGALAYADDITLICPSIRGLNKMLQICSDYACDMEIMFNAKKTMGIKFGETVNILENMMFNNTKIAWCDSIRHLGNVVNINLSDTDDCTMKNSVLIGLVNKLLSNFRIVQPFILCNLFKSYCCSLYGSQLWFFNSNGFRQCCTTWNKAVRKIFNLPYQPDPINGS
jgi:hypothetical protein